MTKKWTGKIERPIRVWVRPKLTDDIFLHFSELLKPIKFYSKGFSGKVLDVGAGKTPYRGFFRNIREYVKLDNHDYEGIDITADVTKRIPVKSETYDGVLCFQVLEHINKPDKAVNEIYRVLKKGGKCLLTTHMAAPLHGEPYDYFRFTKYGLMELFNEFEFVEIKENGKAASSIIQLIVWGISEKLPKFISRPLVFLFNLIGKSIDKIVPSNVFTINYSVYAIK